MQQTGLIELPKNVSSWFFDSETKKFYRLKKNVYKIFAEEVPIRNDFEQAILLISCKEWLRK